MAGKIPPALPPVREDAGSLPMARRLLCVGLCVAALLISGLGMNALTAARSVATTGFDSIPPSRVVLADFTARTARHKVLFIGTSMFFNGIHPAALEREAHSFGCEMDVAVVAYPLLTPNEEAEIMRELARYPALSPDLVVIGSHLASANYRTNPFQLAPNELVNYAIHEARYSDHRPRVLLGDYHNRASNFVLSLVGYRRLDALWPRTRYVDLASTDGYIAHSGREGARPQEVAAAIRYRQSRSDAHWTGWTQDTANVMGPRIGRIPYGRAQELVLSMPTLMRTETAEVSPPGFWRSPEGWQFLNFNSFDVFPEMSDPAIWQNGDHLSNEGSEIFARYLAPQLCGLLTTDTQYAVR